MKVALFKDGKKLIEAKNVVLLSGMELVVNHIAGNQTAGIAFSKAEIANAPSPAPTNPKLITSFPTSGTDTPTATTAITSTVTPDTTDPANPKISLEVSIEFTIAGTRDFNEIALYIGPSNTLFAYSRFPTVQTLTAATYVFNWQFLFSL